MNNWKNGTRLGLFVLFLSFTVSVLGQDFNKGGRTAYQFTKIGVGARQVAIGEATTALVKDVNGVFWNPAAITGVEGLSVSVSYANWLADLNYSAAVVGYTWDGIGTFALSATTLDYGELDEAMVTGQGGTSDARTGNTFTGGDMMIGLTYSKRFTDKLSIGLTGKYLQETLYKYTDNLYAFDIGTYYETGVKGITIGMSAQNFATESAQFLSEDLSDRGDQGYDIPLVFKVGTSVQLVGASNGFVSLGNSNSLALSFDAQNTNDYGERYNLGTEYWFSDFVALRAGYRFNYADGNLTFGFGINTEFAGKGVKIDYAFMNYKYLNAPHRFTVSFTL